MSARISVQVPATTANLGPGFDCLGMALSLFNTVTLSESDQFAVVVKGEGAEDLPRQRHNLAYRAVTAFFNHIGREVPPLCLELRNEIPLTRGLGSSAAAIVGSIVAANELAGRPLNGPELLKLATELEGHPDNVAAALFGGMTICVRSNNGNLPFITIPVPQGLRAVIFIPEVRLATRRSRSVLPAQVRWDDAVHNIGRAALLVAGLATGQLDVLRVATEDRLHQPYREALFPAAKGLLAAALDAGALGVFLSGSGPTVLALTKGKEEQVAEGYATAARGQGVEGRALVLEIAQHGATVIRG